MRALITGASGHLGFQLARELLAAGHTVRAGLRTLRDAAALHRLAALGRGVQWVEADLDRPATLVPALQGIDVLFHAAAVYTLCDRARDTEVQRVATSGTQAVLRAAAQAGVKKVVLTSSVLTVPLTLPGARPSTEADWNGDLRVPYVRAKTEGEQRAWKLAAELGLNLVSILPGSMGGPGFVRNTPTIDVLEAMMGGAFRAGVPRFNLPYVDVRDVAAAHRLAAERDARGRFIVVGDEQPDFRTLLGLMHSIDPRVRLPLLTLPDFMLGAVPFFDRLNARSLHTPRTATSELMQSLRGRRHNASSRRAAELLGWRPRISLRQSLSETMHTIAARGLGLGNKSQPAIAD